MTLAASVPPIYNSRNCYGFIAFFVYCYGLYTIYNSRNCYGFIASISADMKKPQSTIVEIVMAL